MDFRQAIASALATPAALPAEELATWLETPPTPDMGDYAFPCFKLAKTLRKAPPVIAGGACPSNRVARRRGKGRSRGRICQLLPR